MDDASAIITSADTDPPDVELEALASFHDGLYPSYEAALKATEKQYRTD